MGNHILLKYFFKLHKEAFLLLLLFVKYILVCKNQYVFIGSVSCACVCVLNNWKNGSPRKSGWCDIFTKSIFVKFSIFETYASCLTLYMTTNVFVCLFNWKLTSLKARVSISYCGDRCISQGDYFLAVKSIFRNSWRTLFWYTFLMKEKKKPIK